MKCIDCISCKKGWFKCHPSDYVCLGVKHPFVIEDVNQECTEYKWDSIKTVEIRPTEPAKAFVDDDGIYISYDNDPRYHRMLISKDLFVEAYNKWIKGELTYE
jgi:hypothetical protein